MKTKGVPSEIDVHVGQRLRVRRSLMGFSQEKLASLVGLTFQQIQKYERGTNRVSAGRLYELSQILDVPVTYFFEQIASQSNDDNNALGMAKTFLHYNKYETAEAVFRRIGQLTPEILLEVANEMFAEDYLSTLVYD